jgi:hypothetical protein
MYCNVTSERAQSAVKGAWGTMMEPILDGSIDGHRI